MKMLGLSRAARVMQDFPRCRTASRQSLPRPGAFLAHARQAVQRERRAPSRPSTAWGCIPDEIVLRRDSLSAWNTPLRSARCLLERAGAKPGVASVLTSIWLCVYDTCTQGRRQRPSAPERGPLGFWPLRCQWPANRIAIGKCPDALARRIYAGQHDRHGTVVCRKLFPCLL